MARKKKTTQPNTTSQTSDYKGGVPFNSFLTWFQPDNMPFMLSMVEPMLMDSTVKYAITVDNAPFRSAEVEVTSPDSEIAQFVKEQWDRIWTHFDVLLKSKTWGFGGYECVYKEVDRRWEFDYVKHFHPRDIAPLLLPKTHALGGARVGMRVKHIEGDNYVDLFAPNYLWLTFDADYGSHFGRSNLQAAWDAWKNKRLDGGCEQLIKLFYFKMAMVGLIARYPLGEIFKTPDGMTVNTRDLMREAVQLAQYGTCFTLPSDKDEKGNYKFDIQPPSAVSGSDDLLKWKEALKWETFEALAIPKEIVDGQSGLGQAGRSFPMAIFLSTRDKEFASIVREVNCAILRPLVVANFGLDRADYDIEPKSLVETFGDSIGGPDVNNGGPDDGPDNDGPGGGGDGPKPRRPNDPDGYQFSTDAPAKSSGGRWITIGAKNVDGKKKGGTPVKIDGRGRIVSGPAALKGRNVKHFGKTEPMTRYAAEIHETAKRHKIKKSELHEVAQELHKERSEQVAHREAAKAQIRKSLGMTQQDIIRLENSGRDHTNVKRFDERAKDMMLEHPELGIDPDNYEADVWDLLREGKLDVPAKHDPKLLKEAAEFIKANRFRSAFTFHDDVPFSVVQFSAQHAPEGGVNIGGKFYRGGEFIPGDVIDKATDEEKKALKGGKKKQKGMFDEGEELEPHVKDKFESSDKTKQKKLLDGMDSLPGQKDLFDEAREAQAEVAKIKEELATERKPDWAKTKEEFREEARQLARKFGMNEKDINFDAVDREWRAAQAKKPQEAPKAPEKAPEAPAAKVEKEPEPKAEEPQSDDAAHHAAVAAIPPAVAVETPAPTPAAKTEAPIGEKTAAQADESLKEYNNSFAKAKDEAWKAEAWKYTQAEFNKDKPSSDHWAYMSAVQKAIREGKHVPAKVLDQGDGTLRIVKDQHEWEQGLSEDQRRVLHGKDTELTEHEFLEKTRLQRIRNLRGGIAQEKNKLKTLGDKQTNKRIQSESALKWWQSDLKGYEALGHGSDEHKNKSSWENKYREMIREGISKGLITDAKILDQHPEFRKARDARERYEKGRHTSFANKSFAVDDSMKAETGYKAKRQDGKAMTQEHKDELKKGVAEVEAALGTSLKDVFEHTDVTLAHTNGKHPFLSTAVGMYSPLERTVTSGTELRAGPWRMKFKSLAHELGHFLDSEAGAAANISERVYRRTSGGQGKSFDSTHISEMRGIKQDLIDKARYLMNHKQEARLAMKTKLNTVSDDEANLALQKTKLSLGAYWESSPEIWARLFEQYVGDHHGYSKDNISHDPDYRKSEAYWSDADFQQLKPMVKAEIDRRIKMIRDGAAARAQEKSQEKGGK